MRDLSNLKWRSMSGSVPRPIDPKPIITIGPVISPWTGHFSFAILGCSPLFANQK